VKDYPLEIRHRDGHTTPVLYNASLFRDETGVIKGVFAAARTLDAILRVSEKRLRDITHALGEGILVLNEKGDLIFVNPEAERLLGWTESELKGCYTHDLIHCHVRSDSCPILGIFSSGDMCSSDSDTFCRKDGSRFPVSYIASPIWEEGRVVAVVAAFHDISERKSLEERLKKYTGELERSNRDLEQFAYIASHDLQEPLRRITSFTELLAKKYRGRLDEKADSYIEFIKGGTARMGVLITDLLAYSRLSTRAKEFETTDSCVLLEKVLTDLSLLIEESGAVITYDQLPTVMADDTQLRSLFQNLINNALKFRGTEPPMIHISAASVTGFLDRKTDLEQSVREHLLEMKKGWVFSVKDNGIGIAPSYHERIFQVFQRLHTEQEYPGTGIGLAICRKVVERHGGRIWLESEAGKGTTFSFSIPER
ncbi:MAG: ATP-binding protein, partial [Thermodesulfovibrionales bacterium]|jgi:PAS domain S-box-containing protein